MRIKKVAFESIKSIFLSSALAVPTVLAFASPKLSNSVEIENFGHSSLVIRAKDQSILLMD